MTTTTYAADDWRSLCTPASEKPLCPYTVARADNVLVSRDNPGLVVRPGDMVSVESEFSYAGLIMAKFTLNGATAWTRARDLEEVK